MNPFKFILAALRQAGVFGLYMDSGGSSTPSETTQKTDLPDWAKPYAQETLEKTKQLSSAPYQSYNAPRIAGFSPMQEQSFAGAQQLGPSQMGMFGGQLAGAASLGALGTTYNPFRMGQFTSGRAAQYMNPFVEQAMEPQLREAARASEMQRNQEQAKAVGAGAFGGSRQAIVEAERQRNLGQLQGDIRAKGYMSAFDQAQQNFAREQQLREQSRQYGANLGMQGLQTALQGAGQLGALGGQQFGQQKEAIGLQNQLGAQQQALRQQGLTQSYQDFLNEQNYPYRQLGFMSDMIRGLPLGQQSTSQVYQAPGSMAGQLAGLGVGLAGMSRAGLFAEGGEVQEYADGGDVTSDYNVNDIISKLSDVQLQQARAAALNSGDRQRLEMIDGELAQRASLRSGLGGAFDALPQETQDAVTEMANGGIVAFADGGTMSGFETTPEQMAQDELRRQSLLGRQAEESRYSALAEGRTPPVATPAAAPAAAVPAQQTPQPPRAAPQAARAPSASAGTSLTRKEAASAVQTITEAAKVQLPKDETRELTSSLFKEFMSKSDPERAEFKAELKTLKDRAKQIEAEGIGRAMMKFGFGMAASAAKPGVARREGLAGALESAAAAAPVFAESLDETAKLKQAAQDNYMKLRMDNARYESALEQGNMQLASSIANNISQRQLVQADLQQKIVQNDRMFGLEKEKLGIMRSQASQPTAIQKIAGELRAANPSLGVEDALQRASQIAGYSFRSEGAAGGKLAAALTKIDDDYKMLPALMASNPNAPFVQVMAADQKRRRDEAYRLYGAQQPAGVASTAGAGWSIEPVSGGK